MASCRPVLVATDADYQLRPEAIAQAITPRTRAVVTISPNNPTGAVYGEASLREVNRLCAERGIYHIHDEAYEYFTFGQARHFSPASLPGSASHTISMYSFSKTYGFASWRLGYMVIPTELMESVRKIQDTILICAPIVSQYAGWGALQAGRGYCMERLRPLIEVRQQVLQQLSGLGDLCTVPKAEGAFYFLLHIRSRLDPVQLAERLIREHKVAVIPGTAFGISEGCHLRMGYASLAPEVVLEGVKRLVSGLRAILG
jgi:aspartate/methionine/tyrosine aminotransferase